MNQQSVDFFEWDENAAVDEWPAGVFRVRVIHAEDGTGSQSGKRMPRVGFQCKEPGEYSALSHFENYTLGTDENPTGIVKGTMGYKNLMKLALAAQVPPTQSMAQLLLSLKDADVLVQMSYKPDADFKNNITGYYRLGEKPVGIAQGKPMPGQGPRAGAAPGMGQMPPMPGQMGQPTQAPPPQMPPLQGMSPAPQPGPAPVPPVQASPVQVPPPVAPPPPISQPVPQAAPMAATPDAAPQMGLATRCTICQQEVYVSKFGAHVQEHARGVEKPTVGVVGVDQP